jgi:hypothetical protein
MKLLLLLLAWSCLFFCVPSRPVNAATTTERALSVACPGHEHLAPIVDAAARRQLLHPLSLVAVMRVESHCRMSAIGAAGERCAFQVRGVARNGRTNAELTDPKACIETGARWLALMATWCGSLAGGLGAYNSGKCGNGKRYARKVLATVEWMRREINK